MRQDGRLLRAGVLAAVAVGLVLPIGLGLALTAAAAFGRVPGLGRALPPLEPWRELGALPGLGTSLRLTLATGLGSTALAVLLAAGGCAAIHARGGAGGRWIAPLLAVPHAAMAVGLAFLLAPSGWIARLAAPLAGWDAPPALATVNDRWGLALILGLLVKEVPFLLLAMLAASSQVPVRAHLAVARALGRGAGAAWVGAILPQLWPLVRRPVAVVLVYALSVVDMAVILGPSSPPTLAVAVTRWMLGPDPARIGPASAAALLLAGIALGAILLLRATEAAVARVGGAWLRGGGRGRGAGAVLAVAGAGSAALGALGLMAVAALALWSVAWRWPWPRPLPESWSLAPWTSPGESWGAALGATALIGIAAAGLSLLLAVAWLEGEHRGRRERAAWAEGLVVLPLLVPQVAIVFGLNVAALRIGLGGGPLAVVWAHAIFVFPYVMVALSDPWRAVDPHLDRVAASLGASPLRRLLGVRLPVLLGPLLVAAAIGFGASVAQYLTTLVIGAGRVATLATEAVTLSSGSDRRVAAATALLQAALPMAAYALALAAPALLHRERRALSGRAAA